MDQENKILKSLEKQLIKIENRIIRVENKLDILLGAPRIYPPYNPIYQQIPNNPIPYPIFPKNGDYV